MIKLPPKNEKVTNYLVDFSTVSDNLSLKEPRFYPVCVTKHNNCHAYLQHNFVMPRDKRISLPLLPHDEPLEVVWYEDRGVVDDSTLDFTILLLVDILDRTQDVLLPE